MRNPGCQLIENCNNNIRYWRTHNIMRRVDGRSWTGAHQYDVRPSQQCQRVFYHKAWSTSNNVKTGQQRAKQYQELRCNWYEEHQRSMAIKERHTGRYQTRIFTWRSKMLRSIFVLFVMLCYIYNSTPLSSSIWECSTTINNMKLHRQDSTLN